MQNLLDKMYGVSTLTSIQLSRHLALCQHLSIISQVYIDDLYVVIFASVPYQHLFMLFKKNRRKLQVAKNENKLG